MKKIIITFLILHISIGYSSEDVAKATSKKSKDIDSISVAYNNAILMAQYQYNEAIKKAYEEYAKELEMIENIEEKTFKIVSNDTSISPSMEIKKRYDGGEAIASIANGYSAAQLDSIIASLGLPKSSGTKTQKIEIIIKNAK